MATFGGGVKVSSNVNLTAVPGSISVAANCYAIVTLYNNISTPTFQINGSAIPNPFSSAGTPVTIYLGPGGTIACTAGGGSGSIWASGVIFTN